MEGLAPEDVERLAQSAGNGDKWAFEETVGEMGVKRARVGGQPGTPDGRAHPGSYLFECG
eukprot:4404162-Pyramimonas_sp.AAC.1